MGLTDAYMIALRDYLQDLYESDPPSLATIGTIKIGALQDEPEPKPAIVMIHSADPFNEGSIHKEMVVDQRAQGGGSGHRLWGGYAEMGDGMGCTYWYHWWVQVEYYFTRSGYREDRAREANDDLLNWLRSAIRHAMPNILLPVQADDEVLLQTNMVKLLTRQHGGKDTSFIWSSMLEIKGLVFGD